MTKKYYFIVYSCERFSWPEMGGCDHHTLVSQDVIDIHPIQFQLDCNEEYGKERDDDHGGRCKESYMVTFYHELTKEEYHKFKGQVG